VKNEADLIIKKTHRTLATRGMKRCCIYWTDKEIASYYIGQ
jgi:hypothetical protein